MAICRRCCCPWGRSDAREPLRRNSETQLSVKDRVKHLNAADTGRSSSASKSAKLVRERSPQPVAQPSRPGSQSQGKGVAPPQPSRADPQSRGSGVAPSQPSQPLPLRTGARSPSPLAAPAQPLQTGARSPSPSIGVSVPGSSEEDEVTKWVEAVSGERKGRESLMQWLKDGQVLCRMVNKIQPGSCARINSQAMPFKQMENVTAFIQACRKLGVLEKDVFSTVDLYEEKNPKAVVNCIYNLGSVVRRTAPSFKGPYIGVNQTSAVADQARTKTAVTQDSGFRTDIKHEVRAGVTKGRHM